MKEVIVYMILQLPSGQNFPVYWPAGWDDCVANAKVHNLHHPHVNHYCVKGEDEA